VDARPAPLDVVELREARGEWPVGTIGTVVESLEDEALVEIVDDGGQTLELLGVPYQALRVREFEPTKRHAPDNPGRET
jgi:hypothetical protein